MAAIPTQNHIHLSTVIGSAPENAPNQIWTVTERRVVPVVFLSPSRGLKAKFYPNVLKNGANPVQLRNFKYVVKVADFDSISVDDRFENLLAMYGKKVKLVDVKHANNGSDHTSYIRNMVLTEVGELKADHLMLSFYYVEITLEDDSI